MKEETPDPAVERVLDEDADATLDTVYRPCTPSWNQVTDRKYFAYDMPLPEETGAWIPVSIPPTGHAGYEVDFFPDLLGSNTYDLTAWRILIEAIVFLCGAHKKGRSKKCGRHDQLAALPFRDYEDDAFDPLASSLTDQMEDHVRTMSAVLAAEPPQWLPDSHAAVCMQCGAYFHPIFFSRHHCRFCGLIFCGSCTSQRTLLPVKFREKTPQRVCDSCYEQLAAVQGILFEQVSSVAQEATHDVTDLSCLRAWINSPLGFSLEHDICKATNTLQSFMEIGRLKPERTIPEMILKGAKGLAVFTVVKVGMMVTYKVGTGLVIAKRPDGSWSAPSAIISTGVGWGPQGGGEITDFILVLRNGAAVKAFAGRVHLSLGAGLSVAAGPLGRTFEADVRAGDGGATACYTYSLSKGLFAGCSLEGNVVLTRVGTNVQFYGDPSISATEILMGSVKQPKAAAPLYAKVSELFYKAHGSRR
ncbi:hypothetical protein GOP47_0022892 [Adiantum capillus-veneris]|uniref:FYVE-type domain-containing protein n=1 Tax=Adiantum capillus-veneris TaxID=13818 RepID=A0A9D4U6F8_ADICA|nr:hypothetical protein GOP47_0022892 [Adiantum capillus-veneris]